MLVLSRKEGERIKLEYEDIEITVVVVRSGDKVRLGIQAPKSVHIRRSELEPPKELEGKDTAQDERETTAGSR